MPGAVIEARALSRRFAGVTALQAIDLTVQAGEAVAVFGPNGAGKSTLLRLLATLLRPSAGTLHLFERPVHAGGTVARRRIGFLSHHSFLYPDLTPTENLDFYARMFGIRNRAERVHELMVRVGLTGWAHRPVRTLSRGLEQRCALARALVHEPELLLLDEPFTGLDVDAVATLLTLLRRAHTEGAAILITTHDIARGLDICARGVILARGQLLWDGGLDGVSAPEFVQRYRALTHGAVPPAAESRVH